MGEFVRVDPIAYDDPVAASLRADLLADLSRRYDGDGDATPIAPGEFEPPNGAFLVAWLDDVPVGCVGWRRRTDLPDDLPGTDGAAGPTAELKRMWVDEATRGRGIARALLAAVEESARSAGCGRVVLETGTAQPEAIGLYQASGYRPTPGFGHYRDEPDSRSFARAL